MAKNNGRYLIRTGPRHTVRSMPREDNNVEVERKNRSRALAAYLQKYYLKKYCVAQRPVAAPRPESGPSPVRGKYDYDSLDSDGLEVAFTLSCSGSDKPMAPRRKCNVCGSQQWHKEPATGLVVCSEGHVLQVRGLASLPLLPFPAVTGRHPPAAR